MKPLICVTLASLLLGSAAVSAEQNQRSKHLNQKATPARASVQGEVRVVFSTGDVKLIHEYYAPEYRHLPRGMSKKLVRTGTLPPGWQKKMQPFPLELARRLGPVPDGFKRGVINGQAVIYNSRTHVILDVTVLF